MKDYENSIGTVHSEVEQSLIVEIFEEEIQSYEGKLTKEYFEGR